jgi:hypothetical protein
MAVYIQRLRSRIQNCEPSCFFFLIFNSFLKEAELGTGAFTAHEHDEKHMQNFAWKTPWKETTWDF